MSWIDNIQGNLNDVAAKVGLPPDQVKAITETLQGQLGVGSNQIAALEATAAQHGIPVDKLKELLGHGGASLGDQFGSIAGNLFKAS